MNRSRRLVIRDITINAAIAAIYFVLAIVLGNFSFGTNGFIDFRLSEILMILAIFSPRYFPGLMIGCLIVNIYGGLPWDMLIGTLQTVIACFILFYVRINRHLAIILAALTCGIMIGLELYFLGFSTIGLWIIPSVFLSELFILEVGYWLFKAIMQVKSIKKIIEE